MKARNLPGRALLGWTLCVSSPLLAASGVMRWESTFLHPLPGSGSQSVIAARELADGTTLVVDQDNRGFTTLRYDHSGNQLSSATFYPVYLDYPHFVSVDPFGAVFFASGVSTDGFGNSVDIWMMKYDGLTGAGLWPSGVTIGAGNHAYDNPLALMVDGAGDVILQAASSASPFSSVTKYSGQSGQLIWGPVDIGSASLVSQLDAAGDLYVAGHDGTAAGTFYLTKYTGSAGSVVWRTVEPGHDLKPVGMGIDGSGNGVVSGGATSVTGSFEADKYSGATGQRIWGPAVWTPPSGNSGQTGPDRAAVGSDGSVVIFGHTAVNSQASRALLKFRGADGGLVWGPIPVLTDPATIVWSSTLTLAGNGDPVLSAQVQIGQGSADAKLWRFDGNTGDPAWGPEVTSNAGISAAFVASNGRVFVGLGVSNAGDEDAVVLERDGATGAPAWGPTSFTGVGSGSAYLYDVTAAPNGNGVVTGRVTDTVGNGVWATLKYDRATGATLWGPVYFSDGFLGTTPWRVLTDAAGDVLVGGTSAGGMTIVKYSGSTGASLWTATVSAGIFMTAFAVDPSGNAIVSGYSDASGSDAVTAKISGANGATLWGPIVYDSGSDDYPDVVTTDSSGNVILGGHSSGVSGVNGFLVRYAAANGSTMWGPTTQPDQPASLAVDSAGNIFRGSCCFGITTTKYDGATGAAIWGPTIFGGFPSSAYGTALALDDAGDVLATGTLYNGHDYDYAVLKYHGSDGALLWGPSSYDSGSSDSVSGIVVDGSGHAVVTGTSRDGPAEIRTATVSFDGGTGALRWGPVGRNIARDTVNGLVASGSTVYVGATRGDLGYIVDAIDESLGIVTLPGALPAVSCGHAIDVPLGAANGTPPYAWSIVGGGLPPAVVLGVGGDLIGTPQEEGVFAFTVQVQDAALAKATRAFTLAVGPGAPLVPVTVTRDDACQLTLSVDGGYTAYDWLPDGESTPQIVVDPTEPATYGVVLNDGTPCRVRGAVTIVPLDPACLAPTVVSISPTSGPDAGTPVAVSGTKFDASAALSIGGLPASGVVFENAGSLQATTPVLSPGAVADVLVVNPDGRYGQLLRAFAADFLDVPSSNPFYADIMKVLRAGITAGCGNGDYCPNGSVTRAQMAVFLLKAQHGFFYVPPPCAGVFADVACPGAFAADWIEQLASEGITGGCGGGNYCPDAAVTRQQMAVFLLKAEHGSNFTPPPCIGIFNDVPCSSPFASWIEQLYDEGITGGCGNGNYCPANPNTRAQMAVFLSKTFGLP